MELVADVQGQHDLVHGELDLAVTLSQQEKAHAESIADLTPTLVPIPPKRVTRITCAIPVRKPAIVVDALIATLATQRLRIPVQLDFIFLPNYASTDNAEDALQVLATAGERLRALGSVTILPNAQAPSGDYGEGSETRQWSKPAFERLAMLKNSLLQRALDANADFVWLLDADVMCDPGTLQSMLDSADHESWRYNETIAPPIVSAVYWTRWQRKQAGSTDNVHSGPQVWLVHPYKLSGRGWTEEAFRAALAARKRVRVYGLGACTLIPRAALVKGVHFGHFDGLPAGPMSEGEDRHFCARANALHVPLIADAWPDIVHAYHPSEYGALQDKVRELAYDSVDEPGLGDLVSARLELLEPVVDAQGRAHRMPPRWVRGQVGSLPVLPQVEETLTTLKCGESRLIKLHFPSTWPDAYLRLKSLVARVTLYDAKAFRQTPVLAEEHFLGIKSKRVIDHVQHTDAQLNALVADVV